MYFLEYAPSDVDELISKYIEENTPITSKDAEFSKWYELSKENIKVLNDSVIVITNDIIDSYSDEGSYITGIPLFKVISFEESDNPDTKVKVIDVKIPYKLDINYISKYDESRKYTLFTLENMSNLFKSNMSEQNVDNSYIAVKELLDGKFNLMRQLNYEDIPFTLSEICSKNAIKGFQLLIYELLVASLSRSLHDTTKEFRLSASNKEDYKKFQMINVRDISRNNSAFSALASENISKSLLVALSQSKKSKDNSVITPQEKIALGKY